LKREYPKQPLIGVGAIIIIEGKILLVQRGTEPGKNKWSIPGGLVKLGETIQETVTREVKEESNLDVEAYRLIDAVNNLEKDSNGNLRYHFVIIDFFAKLKSGILAAGSDVLKAKWVPFDEVEEYNLTSNFRNFFQRNRKTLEQLDSTNC
jgi:ADP-ribose pyrophosphatase YjhB (NUDIX family)